MAGWRRARGDGELLVRRGDGGDRRAQQRAELDRSQAHAAAGAQHDELLAGLHPADRAQHVVRRAVGDAEGGGEAEVGARGEAVDSGGADDGLLGERAHEGGAGDEVADRQALDVVGHLADRPGQLAPGGERHRDRQLVLVGHQQHVGEVHRGRVRRGSAPGRVRAPARRCPRRRRARATRRRRRPRRAPQRRSAKGSPAVVGGLGEVGRLLHRLQHDRAEGLELTLSPARWKPCSRTMASFHLARTV